MLWPPALRNISHRLASLRVILLSASFLGMLACAPLWLNSREYPLIPVAAWFPTLMPPWDKYFFGGLLGSLVLALWFYRSAVLFFLSGSLFLVLGDQNRAQPWFYMYWIMLCLSLVPEPSSLAACRCALSAVYVWGGLQKCQPGFYKLVVPWFVQPASHWLPARFSIPIHWLVGTAPMVEIFVGLGLWFPATRMATIVAGLALHAIALLFLGPLGHNYNLVVWAWNLAMAALVLTLSTRKPIGEILAELRQSSFAVVILALFWFLPVLSFFGMWDSYLSFAVYSGNVATADIFVTESFRDRLPESLRGFVHATRPPFNPQIQGPYLFDHQTWALKDLGVPGFPEPRGFRRVQRYMAQFASDPAEIRMVVAPRHGPAVFYQGERSWLLVPPKE